MRRRWWLIAPLALLGIAAFMAIGGLVVRELWNWLLPSLFGLRAITFWQALGILVLSRILFGGFGGHRGHRSGMRGRLAGRWEAMTPEERERFRQGLRARCGFGPDPAPGGSQAPPSGL